MSLLDKLRHWGSKASASAAVVEDDRARALGLIDQGNDEEARGRLDAAMALYEDAARIAPTLPRARLNVGNVRLARGDATGALEDYDRALALDATYAAGHFNRGNALLSLRRVDDALAAYRRAAELDPGFVDAPVAVGAILEDLGRLEEAAAQYRAALALDPAYAPVLSNLGNVLRRLRRFDEAVSCQRRAVELAPTLGQAHVGLGNALKDVGRLDEAEAAYRQALALEPGRLEARAYGEAAARTARPYSTWQCTPQPERTLRVGLVSGDLRDHPVGYFLESTLQAARARCGERLHWFAYASARCDDAVSARLRACTTQWRDVEALSDAALAAQIHTDAIDILVDLAGHTGHTRLPAFCWRPSPVQASWLGYFATTGVAEIDYLIADRWTLPETLEAAFTEQIWRLPDTRLCFTAPASSPPVGELPAATTKDVTFGCFNHLAKMHPGVVAVWSRVMQAVPGSRLLLKSPPLESEAVRADVAARFAAHGVAAHRLVMAGLSSRGDYLATYGQVDIALDPFPYPGGTTTAEALWMGVPVVTLRGDSFLSRQGVGLLTNVGRTDWIADSADDYLRIAVAKAQRLQDLAALRRRLRADLAASPLMDADRFAGHLEAAFRGMWRLWCERRAPRA